MIKDLANMIKEDGAKQVWEDLKLLYPIEYNLLLLASIDMQAKELENLKGHL